ncbi:PorT family protein [Paucihalobacter ruber]|uniref:PorT family protein n=1 Tax=Paucihalobacter ruber TaxID=2567861 RepID=A0A506PK06_9FLAO|nr:outer membrane beta-barrel protein [Paucihalobacter ruber]TPV33894.1 PorT family protein [Paucihalobacter ruber]
MKKLFLTTCFITLFGLVGMSQNGSGFGIKGGLNYNGNGDYFNSISTNFENPDNTFGYHLGIFGKIGNKVYLRPELVYTKTKSDYNSGTFDMSKLDAPILVGLKIIGPLHVFAGPSFQYILDTEFEGVTIDNIENDFSIGLNFGIGVNFNSFGIDLRYERGFSENEGTFLDNNLGVGGRLDTRPEQLILSLSIKLF